MTGHRTIPKDETERRTIRMGPMGHRTSPMAQTELRKSPMVRRKRKRSAGTGQPGWPVGLPPDQFLRRGTIHRWGRRRPGREHRMNHLEHRTNRLECHRRILPRTIPGFPHAAKSDGFRSTAAGPPGDLRWSVHRLEHFADYHHYRIHRWRSFRRC
uniref:(northern house mosquito) hypothetical protein n=2 Tax=Culex pipiens TaxID=7175 RepID=A0A8D8GCY3_CULPI